MSQVGHLNGGSILCPTWDIESISLFPSSAGALADCPPPNRTLFLALSMRRKVTVQTLHQFMRELAAAARSPGKVYFTGGATALLLGFRDQTIDIDLKLDPEPEGAFEAISKLKSRLDLNVELASPDDFIPAPAEWRERSRHIASIGQLEFYHYDFALQALAKIERGHSQDLEDATQLLRQGYVSVQDLEKRFARIEPALLRYPAIDPPQFKRKLDAFLAGFRAKKP